MLPRHGVYPLTENWVRACCCHGAGTPSERDTALARLISAVDVDADVASAVLQSVGWDYGVRRPDPVAPPPRGTTGPRRMHWYPHPPHSRHSVSYLGACARTSTLQRALSAVQAMSSPQAAPAQAGAGAYAPRRPSSAAAGSGDASRDRPRDARTKSVPRAPRFSHSSDQGASAHSAPPDEDG